MTTTYSPQSTHNMLIGGAITPAELAEFESFGLIGIDDLLGEVPRRAPITHDPLDAFWEE